MESFLSFSMQTRQSGRERLAKNYNPYGDNFVVDRTVEDLVVLEEITASQDVVVVDDQDKEWLDDRSKHKVEFDDEQKQSLKQELTNLRLLVWFIPASNLNSYPI